MTVERDGLRVRMTTTEADLDRVGAQRDVWAECARALASALCREPGDRGEPQHDGEARSASAAPARERLLRSVNT